MKRASKGALSFRGRRKGVIEIEFIISVFVFITTISFVTLIIVSNIPTLHNTAAGESVKSWAYQYSEMLLMDEGAPKNWDSLTFGEVKRIGFSDGERYMLNYAKLQKLRDACNDPEVSYNVTKNRLGVDFAHDIVIEVSTLDGSPVIGSDIAICRPLSVSRMRQQFHITILA